MAKKETGQGWASKKESSRDGVADMRQQLKTGIPASCLLLYGEEVFLIERYVKEIRDLILQPDTAAFNEIILEGRVRPEAILDACETYPVFAERKLVLVKKSGLFKAARKKATAGDGEDAEDGAGVSGADAASDGESAGAARDPEPEPDKNDKFDWKPFFESLPSHTLLVFVEETANKTLGLYKLVDRYGLAAEMPLQKPDMLNKWIQKGFAQSEKRISPDDADFLMHRAEDGMTALHQEIDKVRQYMGERTDVTKDDIRAVVTPSIRSRVFDLMDAVAGGERARALLMLDEMIQKREPEQKIFYMLGKQMGRLMQIKRMGPGLSADRKAERLGMNAYALSKLERLAGRLSEAAVARFVQEAAEMDMAVKGGRIKMRLALELLMAGAGQN